MATSKILDGVAGGTTLSLYVEYDFDGTKKIVRMPIAGGDYSDEYQEKSIQNVYNTLKTMNLKDINSIENVSVAKQKEADQSVIVKADREKKEADAKIAETALHEKIGKVVTLIS